MTVTSFAFRRCLGTLLIFTAVCLVSGCGKKTGTVTGTVTYQGKTLNGGTVGFVHSNGTDVATAPIQADGKYTIGKIPVGTCKITVSTPTPISVPGAGGRMMDASKMGGSTGGKAKVGGETDASIIKVPDKYGQTESSGLSFDVKQGPNTHDIKLD
jgi:hypothetical protein